MSSTPAVKKFCSECGQRMQAKQVFGRERAVCPACGHIHFEDPKVAVAVLVEQDGGVLLVRRGNIPEQGKWTLPAGFMDAQESPQDAAVRECLEETGLRVRVTTLLDVISGREHPRGADIVILYRAQVVEGALAASDDAVEVGFFPLNGLPPIAFEATRRALNFLQKED